MESPQYICEYNCCRKKSILKSACCSKYYCSQDHCQRDGRGHKNCSFLRGTLEGTKSICAFDVNDPEDHYIFEDPILILPSVSKSSPISCCLDCGVVVQEEERCIGCQWPLCVRGCESFEAKACHTAMECKMLGDASGRGLIWDGDVWKYGAIWLIRMAIFKCRQPDLFSWIIQQKRSRRLSPPEEFRRVGDILTTVDLVRELLDVLDLSEIYGLISSQFRSVPPSYQKHILVLSASLMSIPHGCFPNVSFSIANDNSMKIWPIKPLEGNESLWICYDKSILLLPKKARRDLLKGQSLTCSCNCPRCEDPSEFGTYFSSVNCESCQASGDEAGKLCESGDVYICSVCDRQCDPGEIEEFEKRYCEYMARSWNNLYYLKMKLKDGFSLGPTTGHSLIHRLHYLYFQSSWRLLELLLKESLVHVERIFQDFVPQAQTVHRILKTFVPFEIERPSGPVRLMSCILLLNLVEDLKSDRVGLVQAELNLRSIFFWMTNNHLEFSMDFQIYTKSRRTCLELEDLEKRCRDLFVRAVANIVKVRTPVKRLVNECLSSW